MKQKKYWLEGGIIGIITIVLTFVVFFVSSIGDNQTITEHLLSSWRFIWRPNIFFLVIQRITEFFVIGAVVGWIYGKIFGRRNII